jgi:hypothetical protein
MYTRKVSAFKRTAPVNPCSLIVGCFLQCFGSQQGIGTEFWYFTMVSAAADVALKSMSHDRTVLCRWDLQVSSRNDGTLIVLSWSSNSEKCLCEWCVFNCWACCQ